MSTESKAAQLELAEIQGLRQQQRDELLPIWCDYKRIKDRTWADYCEIAGYVDEDNIGWRPTGAALRSLNTHKRLSTAAFNAYRAAEANLTRRYDKAVNAILGRRKERG